MNTTNESLKETNCPRCGKPLSEVVTTTTGRKLQRCSAGKWDPETKQTEGCPYVKWHPVEPKTLDEKCPKCGANLLLATTRSGNRLKKCSTQSWDKETKTATGCDYIEWVKGKTEPLDEKCPQCNEPLVLYTSAKGKRLKKCSTSGWDVVNRTATGCAYVEWLNVNEQPHSSNINPATTTQEKREKSLNNNSGNETPQA